ncbi:hypothetical protein [Streptomyces sp. ME19-01-6]|uniref:hypothetical protein n=1 Tax=Streptomyces sp. ME19-01-6 TaxID=3028686 RepID=UPI0029AAD0B1|nr:hypothetical protein [Streptomyces sp. ME19-01-6]MDX3229847.1 hypothetical protein [Streptomyces sp. ME19-01-6]
METAGPWATARARRAAVCRSLGAGAHYPDFAPDERAIGVGVRAMAGWVARRTRGA